MSFKYDGPLVAGAFHFGTTSGLGVLGALVPATGEAGASYLYNDVLTNDLLASEVRGYITRFPANGTLQADEFGAFAYVGATDYFLYQLIVDGVAADEDIGYGPGIGRVDLISGQPSLLQGAATLDDMAASGYVSGSPSGIMTGGPTLDDLSTTGELIGRVVIGAAHGRDRQGAPKRTRNVQTAVRR